MAQHCVASVCPLSIRSDRCRRSLPVRARIQTYRPNTPCQIVLNCNSKAKKDSPTYELVIGNRFYFLTLPSERWCAASASPARAGVSSALKPQNQSRLIPIGFACRSFYATCGCCNATCGCCNATCGCCSVGVAAQTAKAFFSPRICGWQRCCVSQAAAERCRRSIPMCRADAQLGCIFIGWTSPRCRLGQWAGLKSQQRRSEQ